MGPERATTSRSRRDQTKSPADGKPSLKYSGRKRQNLGQDDSATELPGVQKLKAALRQTRRLLAKDSLAADVRVETERRLKSLESDLQTAELKRIERTMAKRYHKVKFFERQKVLRKIKRVKRDLDRGEATSSKEPSDHLETSLYELRVQLNYVLNYPKLEKYISLFLPSKEKTEQNPDLTDEAQSATGVTDARREQLLREIRAKMAAGQVSTEPELEVESRTHAPISVSKVARLQGHARRHPDGYKASAKGTEKQAEFSQPHRTGATGHNKAEHTEEDDFFDPVSGSDPDPQSPGGSDS